MPYQHELGTDYLTTSYHFGSNSNGYYVRVLSIADGTTVSVPGLGYSGVHDVGSFHEFEYPLMRQATPISCSQPCIVAQYAYRSGVGDSPGAYNLNPFMLILTPKNAYSTNAIFATSGIGDNALTRNALSLSVNFYPVDDLYLDDESLEDLDWMSAPGLTGWFATMTISHGTHHLYTLDPDHR